MFIANTSSHLEFYITQSVIAQVLSEITAEYGRLLTPVSSQQRQLQAQQAAEELQSTLYRLTNTTRSELSALDETTMMLRRRLQDTAPLYELFQGTSMGLLTLLPRFIKGQRKLPLVSDRS